MNEIIHTIKKNKIFLAPFGILFLIGVTFLFVFEKSEITLIINNNHNQYLDLFFTYLTMLGEAPLIIFTLLFVFIKNKQQFISVALAFLLMAATIALLKYQLFSDNLRPRAYINDDSLLHFIKGVDMHLKHSFPSGHTTTAFLGYFIISSYSRNVFIVLSCLLLAIAVGYSRMYLGQHFYEDVFVGSAVGVLIGILALSFKVDLKKETFKLK